MTNPALLAALTDLLSKEAELLLALVNFYGFVVIAVIGWIVNTGKDGPGVSWVRVVLFNLGFLCFFAATYAGFVYLYDRISVTTALWAEAASGADQSQTAAIHGLVWLPQRQWLWLIWGFNAVILALSSMLLRQGGYGRVKDA